jgi:hypothetical protein
MAQPSTFGFEAIEQAARPYEFSGEESPRAIVTNPVPGVTSITTARTTSVRPTRGFGEAFGLFDGL